MQSITNACSTENSSLMLTFNKRKSKLFNTLQDRQVGKVSSCRFYDEFANNQISLLKLAGNVCITDVNNSAQLCQMIPNVTANGIELILWWSISDSVGNGYHQKLALLTLNNCFKKHNLHKFNAKVDNTCSLFTSNLIRNISACPVQLSFFHENHHNICIIESSSDSSKLAFKCLECSECPQNVCLLGSETVWCSASSTNWLSVGCDRTAYLVKWASMSNKPNIVLRGFGSSIFAQVFDKDVSTVLPSSCCLSITYS